MEAFSHITVVQSSPPRIRQGLISLLNLDEPLGVLLDPIRRRNIRVVLPGQLLVRLLDFQQRSRLGYAQKVVEGLGFGHRDGIVQLGLDSEAPDSETGMPEADGEEDDAVWVGSGGGNDG